ncbi:ABC transporter ATP-binding protein [Hydrogenimonas sp. SS33]|uniref:ABC transporter ATP-binding protein n=1 Tax=Hydrogenimonas leucolamina TaxID=2954236 RepID=UPI00336BD620
MIELKDVTKRYGDVTVLENFSLKVERGERLAVVGPSGCGKTTLLRLIAGFEAPQRGEVRLQGRPVAAEGAILVPPEKRGVGMVFQDLALWPHMRVFDNIAFGLKMRGLSKKEIAKRVGKWLEAVGLEGLERRYPAQLSGGQRQRVALARALATEPSVLLMDEPLSSLDETLRGRLAGLIVELQQKRGFTLLYVTHDRREVETIATRVYRME